MLNPACAGLPRPLNPLPASGIFGPDPPYTRQNSGACRPSPHGRNSMKDGAIPFRKMNGLSNEFIVFDARQAPVRLTPIDIRALGNADAIGFDQMITIE